MGRREEDSVMERGRKDKEREGGAKGRDKKETGTEENEVRQVGGVQGKNQRK